MENLPVIYGEMGGGKGGKGHTPVEADDTLSSKQTMRLLFALSEGQIDSVEDILLNSASISNYSSTVSYEVRTGFADQEVIKGFSEVEAPISGAGAFPVELKAGVEHTYSLLGMYDAARINLTIDRLMEVTDQGDRVGYSVSLSIYKRHQPFDGTPGSWQPAGSITKNGKCTNPYSWDVRLEKPTATQTTDSWEIRVVRDSADDSDDKHYSGTYLSAITTIVESSLTYPHTALVGVTLTDAAVFGGSIPEIKFKVKGIKLPLPVNYDPITRSYSGVWNGAFTSTRYYTDNLAWITYWVLREHGSTFLDSDWGLGIAAADIDVGSFYLYAQHCDQLVSDGKDGQEPRYTCHVQFIERDNVPTFLTYLLTLGNANFSTNSLGQIAIIWDGAGQAITKVVSNANVIEGMFEYSSNDLEGRTNLVNVTYAREELFGDSDTATHYEQDLIDRYSLQTSDVVLFGCKSEGQALRKARAVLWNNCYSTEIVTFKQLFQGASYSIGELVSIMDSDNVVTDPKHAVITGSSFASGVTTLTLDRAVVLNNSSYSIQFIGADGVTFNTKTINQSNGSFSSIGFAGNTASFIGGTVLFSTTSLTPRVVKVIKIDKDDDQVYTITGLTHDEGKYAYIETVGTLPTPSGSFINFDNFTVPPVANVTVEEIFSSNGVVEFSKLAVDWDWNLSGVENYRATFDISWRRDKQEYQQARNLGTSDFDIEYPLPGVYEIYVWAVNPFSGLRSVVTSIAYNFRTATALSTLLPPTNVVVPNTTGVVFQQRDLPLTWTFPVANETKLDKLKDYVVQVLDYATATVKGTYTVAPNVDKGGDFLLTFAENATIFGSAQRQFRVRVFSRDLVGDLSNYVEVVPNNPAPSVSTFAVSAVFNAAYLKATIPSDPDLVSYTFKKYTAATGGTALATITTVSNYVDFEATAGTEYFYSVTPNDSFGTGNETTRTAGTAISVDADTYTYTGLQFTPNSPAVNYVSWSSFVAIKNGSTSITVNAGNAQWTTGTLYLYYVPGDSIFKSTDSAATAIAAGGRILATYKGGTEITADAGKAFISGDQLIAGSLLANALAVNTAYITNMAQVGNILQSDNYSNSGGSYTGWRIDKGGTAYLNALEIRSSSGALLMSSGTGVTGAGLAAGVGKNLLSYSNFNKGLLDGWFLSDTSGIVAGYGVNLNADYTLIGGNTFWLSQEMPTATFSEAQLWNTQQVSVVGGTKYEFFAYTNAHRCTVRVICLFIKADGSVSSSPEASNNVAALGKYLSGYVKTGSIVTAPADAVSAQLVLAKNNTDAGQTSSYMFVTNCYFGEAGAGQTELSAWSVGNPEFTITANNTTTYIDAYNGKVLNNLQQWNEVQNSTGTRPDDNATKSRVFQQATAPSSGMTLNDLWVNTTTLNPAVYRWSGASWMLAGDITANNTAAGIAGQGAFATLNQVTAENASTYIANAAIGSAFIADAAIGNAQLQDAAITNAKIDRASVNKLQVVTADIVDANVSTLKIAGNAVTVPLSVYSSGTVNFDSSWVTTQTLVTGIISPTENTKLIVSFGGCPFVGGGEGFSDYVAMRLLANGVEVYSATVATAGSLTNIQQTASATLEVTVPANTSWNLVLQNTAGFSASVSNRYITAIAAKR